MFEKTQNTAQTGFKKPPPKDQITLRISPSAKAKIGQEAKEKGITRAEHARNLLLNSHSEMLELKRRNSQLDRKLTELENELKSQMELCKSQAHSLNSTQEHSRRLQTSLNNLPKLQEQVISLTQELRELKEAFDPLQKYLDFLQSRYPNYKRYDLLEAALLFVKQDETAFFIPDFKDILKEKFNRINTKQEYEV